MLLKDILTPAMKPAKPCDQRPLWQRRLSADSDFCRAVVRIPLVIVLLLLKDVLVIYTTHHHMIYTSS